MMKEFRISKMQTRKMDNFESQLPPLDCSSFHTQLDHTDKFQNATPPWGFSPTSASTDVAYLKKKKKSRKNS